MATLCKTCDKYGRKFSDVKNRKVGWCDKFDRPVRKKGGHRCKFHPEYKE